MSYLSLPTSLSPPRSSSINRAWQACPSREVVQETVKNAAMQAKAKAETGVSSTKQLAQDHPVATSAIIGIPIAIIAAPHVLSGFGFGTGGIIATSAAAKVQSVHYGAYTCGVFSMLTSIGMKGMSIMSSTVAGGFGGIFGASAGKIAQSWWRSK